MDFIPLALVFLLLLLSILLPSTADEFLINCGSPSPINCGSSSPSDCGVHLFSSRNTVANNAQTLPHLYRTSIVFPSPSAYQFNILASGTYLLRLHFLSSTPSRFSVSASGRTLLPDFTPPLNSLLIHEFLLPLTPSQFRLFFVPASPSATAFVTAIELFLTPLALNSSVLHPIHRINFGGQTVPSSNDRLRRTWLSDDPYLQSKGAARNGPIRISRPNYRGGSATDYDAPDAVYNTAKELNGSSSSGHLDHFFNASWSFPVARRSPYFVRAHFCDIISPALGATVFHLYINTRVSSKVDPYAIAPYLAAPFYLDFVVESDDTGFMSVSVGPSNDTRITENAFINGLEIMEILSTSAVEPQICDPGFSKIGFVAIVGLVFGILALGYLLYLKPYIEEIRVKTTDLFPHWQFMKLETGGVIEQTGTKLPGYYELH